jgi:hypothetical protein
MRNAILLGKSVGMQPLGRLKELKRRTDLKEICYENADRGTEKFPDWLPGARATNGAALCH